MISDSVLPVLIKVPFWVFWVVLMPYLWQFYCVLTVRDESEEGSSGEPFFVYFSANAILLLTARSAMRDSNLHYKLIFNPRDNKNILKTVQRTYLSLLGLFGFIIVAIAKIWIVVNYNRDAVVILAVSR